MAIVSLLVGGATLIAGLLALNYFNLQSPLNEVLASDPRNSGIGISVHYGNYLNPSILVFDVTGISGSTSRLDVFRVLFQYAETMRASSFDWVELACKGKTKFKIEGSYFKQMGQEYSWQNPLYTLRTFPANTFTSSDLPAFPERAGGLFAVVDAQLDDFNDLGAEWFFSDPSIIKTGR